MGNGGNFDVPQEVMAVLPQDPYEQLEIARRITAMAVVESLSKLESENGKLRTKLAEKDYAISELQDRVSDAEGSLQETESRLSAALDDHSKVTNEKNLLVNTVKKLNRDVAKLETFKRTLMQSLQDDGDEHKPAAGGGGDGHGHASSFASIIGASNAAAAAEAKKVSKDSWRSSSRASVTESDEAAESGSTRSHESNDVKHVEVDNRPMSKPHQQPNRAAVPAPASQSPPQQQQQQHQAPAPVESSQWQSSARSPERAPAPERAPPVETKLTMPLSLPSSRSTTAPNSPPNANSQRTPRVDGKEFFRQARNRLSYEQFSSFLANIKELNAHRQSREETLRKADKTFGPENKDLYIAFDGLLSRHLAT